MTGPLSGVTIVDLTSVISGPLATSILDDQGARVIKVETLQGDTMRMGGAVKGGVSSLFSSINRNKESIAVNLQEPRGAELIKKLATQADVCIQNYRPGVVEKLGVSFEDLTKINPALIYASISGMGADGPYAGRRVYDPVIQAYAGFSAVQRENDEPGMVKMMVCDKVTSLTMAQAITAALYHRRDTGLGQHVEVSMLEACLYFIWPDRISDQSFVEEPDRPGGDITALYKAHATLDGHITFMTLQLGEFQGLCRALGRDDLITDERFSNLMSMHMNLPGVFGELRQAISRFKTDDLATKLAEQDVPFGVVLDGDGIVADPQVVAQSMLKTFRDEQAGEMRLVNRNSRFSATETGIRRPAPALGEHTTSILTEFGYAEPEIQALKQHGVVN